MSDESCCICAKLLKPDPPSYLYSVDSEKPKPAPRDSPVPTLRLPCCARSICQPCIDKNPRFGSYCPFCQVSSVPTSLPQGLRDPPSYSSRPPSPRRKPAMEDEKALNKGSDDPPPYSTATEKNGAPSSAEDSTDGAEDVVHFLRPDETLQAVSIAYKVPLSVLRSHNSLYSDNLISARKTVSIPSSHYRGPSLSSTPIDSEEEAERKTKLRRFMTQAKCHEYDLAELYLGQANGDLERALDKWWDDEKWEKENPLKKDKKGKSKGGIGGGLTSQLR